MSGIFGIVHKNGAPVRPEALQTMQQAMAYWGQDGNGIWQTGSVGLGHVLQHNTPESLYERQPCQHPHISELILTADARIDNRDELFESLSIPHPERSTLPDNLLIMSAYDKWGTACVDHLLGAFAFVVWDGREQSLFCARDHIGFRPLYYYDAPDRFVFASDVNAILAILTAEGVPYHIDEEALIAHYVRYLHLLKARTFFRGIAKLQPAQTLSVDKSTIRPTIYWRPGHQAELRFPSTDTYVERLREQLQRAVSCRLRSIHPIGSQLSGGLDSSAVTVLAARQLQSQGRSLAHAYSWSPPPTEGERPLTDERALVEMICQQEGLCCAYTDLTPDDVVAYWRRDISTEPTETLLHELISCRQAVQHQVGVILSGWGGDEVVTNKGRGYFSQLLTQGRWSTLLREIQHYTQLQGGQGWRVLLSQAVKPLIPNSVFALLDQNMPQYTRNLPPYVFFSKPAIDGLAQDLRGKKWQHGRVRVGIRRNQCLLLENGHLAYRIESWAQAGARHGIEYRYPLLDQRLLAFCLTLPADLFFQHGWSRFVFRLAMTDLLPEPVCWNKDKRERAKSNVQSQVIPVGMQRFCEQLDQTPTATADPLMQYAAHFSQVRQHLYKKLQAL